MEHIVENIATADFSRPDRLSAEDLGLIKQVRDAYCRLIPVPCTGCGYCTPCLNGVQIPVIFELYNDAIMYDDTAAPRFFYRGKARIREDGRADRCLECGDCVKACPQNIPIPEWLKKAHALLSPQQ
jgi:hypothetical protein